MSIIPIHIPILLKIYRMPHAGLDGPAFIEMDCSNRTRTVHFSDHRIGGRARISVISGELNHYSGTCRCYYQNRLKNVLLSFSGCIEIN